MSLVKREHVLIQGSDSLSEGSHSGQMITAGLNKAGWKKNPCNVRCLMSTQGVPGIALVQQSTAHFKAVRGSQIKTKRQKMKKHEKKKHGPNLTCKIKLNLFLCAVIVI